MHKTQSICPPEQTMLPRDVPDGPWHEITADYFTQKGKEYLLIWWTIQQVPHPVQGLH